MKLNRLNLVFVINYSMEEGCVSGRPRTFVCVCDFVYSTKTKWTRNETKASKQLIITVIINIDPSFDVVLLKIEADYHFTPLSCSVERRMKRNDAKRNEAKQNETIKIVQIVKGSSEKNSNKLIMPPSKPQPPLTTITSKTATTFHIEIRNFAVNNFAF